MTERSVYRSMSASAAIDAQRRRLELHWTDPDSGRCAACGRDGPCPDANDAAVFLAERGLLLPPRHRTATALRRLTFRALRALKVA